MLFRSQWIILTNGLDWQIYRLRFEQPIAWDLVARFDLSSVSLKNERDMEKLIIVTKEGVEKGAREDLYEKTQCVNRFVAGALILSDAVVSVLKREFRKLADGINVEDAEVVSLLRDGVLLRDLLDGEEAESAMAKVSKHFKQTAKKPAPKKPTPVAAPETPAAPAMSLSDQMLAEAAAETTPVNPPPTEQS